MCSASPERQDQTALRPPQGRSHPTCSRHQAAHLKPHWHEMNHRTQVKKLFKQHRLAPKKWMGQNLLVDDRYLQKIIDAAGVEPGETIVEIGAGLGDLTACLAQEAATVRAIEVDSGFVRILEDRFANEPNVEVIHADALKVDFSQLMKNGGKLRVVANLPYSISSRLLFSFCENRERFLSLHILLQQEVAQRLVAPPGTKDYGVLTVLLGVTGLVELLFSVPPAAFHPVPEVTSTFVRVTFPDPAPLQVQDFSLLTRVVKASFSGRRKTLSNALKSLALDAQRPGLLARAADAAQVDLKRRGESLTPAQFVRLADAIHGELARR